MNTVVPIVDSQGAANVGDLYAIFTLIGILGGYQDGPEVGEGSSGDNDFRWLRYCKKSFSGFTIESVTATVETGAN